MKIEKQTLYLFVALAILAAWYFLIHKKEDQTQTTQKKQTVYGPGHVYYTRDEWDNNQAEKPNKIKYKYMSSQFTNVKNTTPAPTF